jgi:hypothetical protein
VSPPSQVVPFPLDVVLLIEARDSRLFELASPDAFFASSSASCLLLLSASNKSTLSLHCSSMDLRESCKAFSVSVRGCHDDGIL